MQTAYIIQLIGGHSEIREEENPVSGKTAEFWITEEESGITTITARVGIGKYASKPVTKTIKLDNIKPEITNVSLTPTPRNSR